MVNRFYFAWDLVPACYVALFVVSVNCSGHSNSFSQLSNQRRYFRIQTDFILVIFQSEKASRSFWCWGTSHSIPPNLRIEFEWTGFDYTFLIFRIFVNVFILFRSVCRVFMICTPCRILFGLSDQEAWSAGYGEGEMCMHGFGGETWRKEPLQRPRHWLEDNIKRDFRKWDRAVDWIVLAPDRTRWRVVVNT